VRAAGGVILAGVLGLLAELAGDGRIAAAAAGLGGTNDAPILNVTGRGAVHVNELDGDASRGAEGAA
jgi:hypothetical protein